MEIQIFIEILLLVAAIYLAFFKSYLTEKGRRAALKEDIDEVTREVEAIKNEFTREQEILKIDLQRVLSNEVAYRNEERNALIQFHATINEWLFSILEVTYNNFGRTNIESLITVRNNISVYYAKTGISKSKIELLIEDKNLTELSQKLYIATLNFHNWADTEFLKLQQNAEQQKSLIEHFVAFNKHFVNDKELLTEMADDEKKLKASAKELIDKYLTQRNAEYFKVKPIEDEFTSLVKNYLKN